MTFVFFLFVFYLFRHINIIIVNFRGEEVSTGTTLVAVEFADGVVIGADSKTSMGTWVANRVTDKLTPVTDNIFVCRSGSAADTQVNL